jgi:hypothetical protein
LAFPRGIFCPPLETSAADHATEPIMSQEATQHYVTWFNDQVTHLYQPKGHLLDGMYQRPIDQNGNVVVWPLTGRIESVQHARGSIAPQSNAANTNVQATLVDFQSVDWIYKIDESKIKYDEKQVAAKRVGMATGRKMDLVLINELNASGAAIVNAAGLPFTLIHALTAKVTLGQNNVPLAEGDIVCPMPSLVFEQFNSYKQVSSRDWVGDDGMPYKSGRRMKFWNGVMFFAIPDEYAPIPSANDFDFFMYSKEAVGFAKNLDATNITYENLYSAWLHNQLFACAAKTLQPAGIVRIRVASNGAITLN